MKDLLKNDENEIQKEKKTFSKLNYLSKDNFKNTI